LDLSFITLKEFDIWGFDNLANLHKFFDIWKEPGLQHQLYFKIKEKRMQLLNQWNNTAGHVVQQSN
jgi:hypothetical protein